MDSYWSTKDWKPTVDSGYVKFRPPTERELREHRLVLKESTRDIIDDPYNPSPWLLRAMILLLLGYPELAVGDAYKAYLLVRKSAKWTTVYQEDDLEQQVMIVLADGLLLTNCLEECSEILLAAISKFPEYTQLQSLWVTVASACDKDQKEGENDENLAGMTALEEKEYRRNGHVLMQSYPWMKAQLFSRGSNVINSPKQDFVSASWNQCTLERSPVRESHPSEDRSEKLSKVFGVIATTDIRRNETLLVDHTSACAFEDPKGRCSCCCGIISEPAVTLPCCSTFFCSRSCADCALNHYHLAVCGKDLSRFELASTTKSCTPSLAVDDQLLLRVLAGCVQQSRSTTPPPHPLQTPLLSRLTAIYSPTLYRPFSLTTHIITPITILELLGIDPFTDLAFDTWVLQTVRARILNNCREYAVAVAAGDTQHGVAVNPLYSFFNHSCDPNVAWEDDEAAASSSVTMRTTRRVHRGDELFINYKQEIEDEAYVERRKVLREWLGFDCQCTRCVQEEAEDQAESGAGDLGSWPVNFRPLATGSWDDRTLPPESSV